MSEPMKIYDGGAAAKSARKQAKSWNGFHLLLTSQARRAVMLSSLKIPMLIVFIVGLAAGIATGAGVGFGLVFGAALALVIYIGYQNDVYKKLYSPDRDQGTLTLPEGMTWEQAVERIRRGFAHPDVEQVTDTPENITFHSKKRGTYQLKNTPDGLKMTILAKPSKSSKKEYLYAVFSSMLLSQVIALLYPEMISAAQVEEEKAQVNKLFKQHGLPMLIEWVIGIVVLALMGYTVYNLVYSDAARSKGVSDGHLSAFPAEATVDEVLDDFFANGKWDNYEQNGSTFVSYTGEGANPETRETVVVGIYFKLEEDSSFGIDRMTWNGNTMNLLEQYAVLSAVNESYCEKHGIASSLLDSTLDSLDDALNDAASTAAEPESEPEESAVEPVSKSDVENDGSTNLTEEVMTAVRKYYEDEKLSETELSKLQSFDSSDLANAWQNAMYTDVYECASQSDYARAWDRFVDYICFYGYIDGDTSEIPDYSEYDDVYMNGPVYAETDDEAESYVNEVIAIAEANGAEIYT